MWCWRNVCTYFHVSYSVVACYSFAETIDLNVADPVAHKHTPYVIILVKMAEEWAKTHGGGLPSTRDEKKQFKVCVLIHISSVWFAFCFCLMSINDLLS